MVREERKKKNTKVTFLSCSAGCMHFARTKMKMDLKLVKRNLTLYASWPYSGTATNHVVGGTVINKLGVTLAQIVTKHYTAPAKNKNNFFDQSKYVVERSSSPSLAKNKHHSSQAKNTTKSFKNKTQPRSRPSICILNNTKQILVQWLYFVQGCLGMLPATQCQARPVVHHPRPDLPVLCNRCQGMLYPTQAVQLPKDNHCEELVEMQVLHPEKIVHTQYISYQTS